MKGPHFEGREWTPMARRPFKCEKSMERFWKHVLPFGFPVPGLASHWMSKYFPGVGLPIFDPGRNIRPKPPRPFEEPRKPRGLKLTPLTPPPPPPPPTHPFLFASSCFQQGSLRVESTSAHLLTWVTSSAKTLIRDPDILGIKQHGPCRVCLLLTGSGLSAFLLDSLLNQPKKTKQIFCKKDRPTKHCASHSLCNILGSDCR